MNKIETMGMLFILLGILCLIGYGIYIFIRITEIPIAIRIGITALMTGILIVLLALVKERLQDIKKEKFFDEGGE
jgi:hypothetical protein